MSRSRPSCWAVHTGPQIPRARRLRRCRAGHLEALAGNALLEKAYAEHAPAPYLSLLIDDCIARGKDYNAGGARYNTSYIQGVGIGSLTDCLSALKHQVFEGDLPMAELVEALRADFEGREALRLRLAPARPPLRASWR